jgi:hypothetical protein
MRKTDSIADRSELTNQPSDGLVRASSLLQLLNEKRTDGIQRLCCRLQLTNAAGEPV